MRTWILVTLLSAGRAGTGQDPGSRATPPPSGVLAGLRPEHPRLLLTGERVAAIQAARRRDALLEKIIGDCMARAGRALAAPPLAYEKIGPRLLRVSSTCLNRVYDLGLAFRLTRDQRYADALRANLLAVCAFPDWNPSHFLDTAEMTHAVAIGYDWCFDVLGADRATIRAALVRLGLDAGIAVAAGSRPTWWVKDPFNWNLVCNAGLTIGALAVAETDPGYAQRLLPIAIEGMPAALATYGPDGAWPEGPGYWDYATRYVAFGLSALESALGHDFGLARLPGLAATGDFPLAATGPTGMLAAYADVNERAQRKGWPTLFWLARRFDVPAFAQAERAWVARAAAEPLHVIWYPADTDAEAAPSRPTSQTASRPALPALDHRFRGPVEVVFMSSGPEPDAVWVAFKAGYNAVNHGHLDLGSFEMDALGERFARDLGCDDYDLPGYFDNRSGGQRWSWFRNRSQSHSVVLLDGQDQAVAARARVRTFRTLPDAACAVVDVDGAFPDRARRMARGIALVAARRAVLVQDEIDLVRDCAVTWAMTTDAEIRLDGRTAVLTRHGKELVARALTPPDAVFTVASAEQAPPQATNQGVRRLIVEHKAGAGAFTIAVLLSPHPADGQSVATTSLRPLREW